MFTKHLFPDSILYKSIADRYRPVRVADGPIMARYRFIKNASWVECACMCGGGRGWGWGWRKGVNTLGRFSQVR